MSANAESDLQGSLPAFAWRQIAILAGIVFLIHLVCIHRYSYFRDELYYLACAQNLAWGYVDHPPLSIAILKLFTAVFGTELWAVRLPGVLTGVVSVFLYANIARLLRGGVTAQLLAAAFVGLAPVCAVVSHLYSMNGFDITLWAVAINLYILAQDPARKKLWIWLGIVLGLALLNKLSGLWLFAGLGLATFLTPRRTELKAWQPWFAVLLAIGIASPHLIWQINHGFPTLEFLENAAKYKLAPTPPWTILGVQIAVTNPAFSVMWIVGAVLVWRNRQWRVLAIPFTMVLLMLLISMRTRENYLAPAYAFVVPAGAIWLGTWLDECRWHRAVYGTITGLLTVFTLSLALPILPPAVFVKVVSVNSVPVPTAEKGSASQMQGLSDMFGWRIMAREAKRVWQALPENTRLRTPVLGMNYGESAAIEFFGRTTPDMPVVGIHNNYWLWGYGDWDGKQIVVVGHADAEFRSQFREWKIIKTLDNPWAVPEEANAPISIARGLKVPVKQFWMDSKRFR